MLSFGFSNLLIVALIGLILRGSAVSSLPLNYGYLLHGHSHFAFGGWLMPMMVWMIMEFFPSLAHRVGFLHWRNISVAILVSAYGISQHHCHYKQTDNPQQYQVQVSNHEISTLVSHVCKKWEGTKQL